MQYPTIGLTTSGSEPPQAISGSLMPAGWRRPAKTTPSQQMRLSRSLQEPLFSGRYNYNAVGLEGETGYLFNVGSNNAGQLQPMQPHPLISPATITMFDFTQIGQDLSQIPFNLLSDLSTWKIMQNGNVVSHSVNNGSTLFFCGPINQKQNDNWAIAYNAASLIECYQQFPANAFSSQYPTQLTFTSPWAAYTDGAYLAFQLAVVAAVPGSTIQVYLTGNTSGAPDWSLDMSTLASDITGLSGTQNGPDGTTRDAGVVFYQSRALTPSDAPVIVITPGSPPSDITTQGASTPYVPFDITLQPIAPPAAYSPTSLLGSAMVNGSGDLTIGPGYPNIFAQASTLAYKDTIYNTMRWPSAYCFNSQNNAKNLPVSGTRGDNILARPQDWYTPNVIGFWNPVLGKYGVFNDNSGSNYTAVMMFYQPTVVAGTVLAFDLEFGATDYGNNGQSETVKVYLTGDPTATPDFDSSTSTNASQTYTSRVLTAADKPVIIIIAQDNLQSFSLTPINPQGTGASAYDLPFSPQIAFSSVLGSLYGVMSPGGFNSDQTTNNGLQTPFYLGLTLYIDPVSLDGGMTNQTGGLLHIGGTQNTGNLDNDSSYTLANALVGLAFNNGSPELYVGNQSIVGNATFAPGVNTVGVSILPNFYNNGGNIIRARLYLNGNRVAEMDASVQNLGPTHWPAMYEAIASHFAYGDQISFAALRFYMEAIGECHSEQQIVAADFTTASILWNGLLNPVDVQAPTPR